MTATRNGVIIGIWKNLYKVLDRPSKLRSNSLAVTIGVKIALLVKQLSTNIGYWLL